MVAKMLLYRERLPERKTPSLVTVVSLRRAVHSSVLNYAGFSLWRESKSEIITTLPKTDRAQLYEDPKRTASFGAAMRCILPAIIV